MTTHIELSKEPNWFVDVVKTDDGALKDIPNHGYLLGMRSLDFDKGSKIVTLTREEAETIAKALVDRVDIDEMIPKPRLSWLSKLNFYVDEVERCEVQLAEAHDRAKKARAKLLQHQRSRG